MMMARRWRLSSPKIGESSKSSVTIDEQHATERIALERYGRITTCRASASGAAIPEEQYRLRHAHSQGCALDGYGRRNAPQRSGAPAIGDRTSAALIARAHSPGCYRRIIPLLES